MEEKEKWVKMIEITGGFGHTFEMIRLLYKLDPDKYGPVVYVMANTDQISLSRLEEHIAEKEARAKKEAEEGWGLYFKELSS